VSDVLDVATGVIYGVASSLSHSCMYVIPDAARNGLCNIRGTSKKPPFEGDIIDVDC
jgi:hypothetical protein